MSESPKDDPVTPIVPKVEHVDDAQLEEEEKLLAGHHDVNYPALLTKDVKGG